MKTFFTTAIHKISLHRIVIISLLFLSANSAVASTITTNGSGNWDSTVPDAPWPSGIVPSSTDDVIIRAGDVITVVVDATVNSITFDNSGATAGTLSVNAGVTLTVTGGISLLSASGSNTTATITGAGTVICASISVGTDGVPVANRTTILATSVANLTVNGDVTVSSFVNGAVTINTRFRLLSGTMNLNGTVITYNEGPGNITGFTTTIAPQTGTLNLTAALPFNLSAIGTSQILLNGAAATVNYIGTSAQTILGTNYRVLKINNASGATLDGLTTAPTLTIGDITPNSVFNDGGFQVTSGGTLNLTSGTFRLGNAGAATAFPAFGTRNINAGTIVEYASDQPQNISAVPSYQYLTFSGAGTKTIPAAVIVSVAEDLSISGGTATFTAGSGATVTDDILGTGPISIGSGTITLSGDWLNNGIFTAGTGKVIYNGASPQIVGALNYNNLTLSGAGEKDAAAGTIAIGATLLNTSVFDVAGSTLTLGTTTTNAGGTIKFSGASNGLAINSGIVEYYGATQTVAAGTYATLNITSAGTKTAGGAITATNLDNGGASNVAAILDMAGNALSATAKDNTGATIRFSGAANGIAINTGTVEYYGAVQTVAAGTYATLNITAAGTKTAGGAITATTLDNGGGSDVAAILDMAGNTLSAASIDNTGATVMFSGAANGVAINSGTVEYYGAVQTVAAGTYVTLNITAAGTKTAGGAITTTNLDNGGASNAAAILDMGANGLAVSSVDNTGATVRFSGASNGVAINSGTVEYYGAAQTVTTGTYATLNITAAGIKTAGGNITATTLDNGGASNVAAILDMVGNTLSAGTIDNTGATIRFSGASNGMAIATGTVEYYGAAQTVAAGTYATLSITSVGTKTAGGAITATTLDNGGASDVASVLDMGGNILTAGAVDNTGATIRFSGPSNGLAIGSGTIEYNGTSQTVTAGSYSSLNINQSVGVAILGGGTTVNGTLTLSAGSLNLGISNLLLGAAATISVASPSSSKMIIASGGSEVRKTFTTTGSFTFPIGDNTGIDEYSPVTVNVTGGSGFTSAYIGASVVDAKHPSNSSGANFLTRYWNITQSGITGCVATVSVSYPNADITGTEASIASAQLNGVFNQSTNPWIKYAALGGNTLTAAGATITAGQVSAFTGITGAAPTVSITGGGVTICIGTPVPLSSSPTGDPTFLYSWAPAAGLSGTTIPNPIANPAATTTYTLTTFDGNGLVATSNTTITVNPLPTPVISGPNVTCSNQTGVIYSTPATANTFVWTVVGGTITAGAGTPSITVTWNGPGPGTVKVTESVPATSCSATTPFFNVTINPNPTPVISGSATVCTGASGVIYSTPNIGGHTYSWGITGGSITAGAGTSSITVGWGAAGTGSLTVTEVITATGCTAITGNYNVAINPNPAPVISGLNTVCAGAVGVVYTTNNVVGNTYVWNITGGTITAGAGTNSVTVTWNPSGPANLSVAETITATGCSVTTSNYNVTINPNPTPVVSGSATVCSGAAGVAYNTPAVAGHSYVWTISGGAITAGAGSNAVTVTWGAAGTGTLTVAETITATGCVVTTAPFNVLINPNPTPVISGLNTVCAGAVGVVYTTNNVVGNTYVWSITGGSITAGAGTNSVTVTWNASGPANLNVAETITATGCSVTTSNYNVTINPNPTPVVSGSATVCSGAAGVAYNTPAVAGHSYVWTISGGAITAGAGTNAVTVTWGAAGTGTLTVAETITATGCVVTTAPFNVLINPNPTPFISGLSTVCENVTGITYTTPGIAGHSYSWLPPINGTIVGGAGTNAITVNWGPAINGPGLLKLTETILATGCSVTTPNFDVNINYSPTPAILGPSLLCEGSTGAVYGSVFVPGDTYVWTISGGTITLGAGTSSISVDWGAAGTGTINLTEQNPSGCSTSTGNYSVTLNPNPTPVISGLNTVCAGAVGVVYTTNNVVGNTYVWNITGGSITAGAGTNSVTVTWNPSGPANLSVAETITATGCSVTTSNYNVTINPNPTPVIGGLATVCSGAAGVAYNTPAVAGHSYVWTISGGAITAGAGTDAVTVTWGAAGTGTLTVAETITPTGCVVTTAPFNVLINPNPTPVISGLNTVCAGAVGVVYTTNNVVGNTYVWNITGGTITAGAGTNSVTVTWNPSGPANLSVAETITATGCSVTTSNYNVTINPNPTPVIGGLATVCSGAAGVAYNTPAVAGHSYVWTISGGAVTAGAGTDAVTVTWGAAGTGTLTVAETITATGCVVTTAPFNVLINPNPTPVISGLNTVCAGAVGVVYTTNNVVGNTYVWNITGGTITAGAGTNSVTVTWNPSGPANLSVAETITATGCSVTTSNYNVTINPNPTPVIGGLATVCSGAAGVAYNTPAVAGHSYVWTISGGAITAGAGTNAVTVTWGAAGTGTLTVAETITATGCVVTTAPFNVLINPNPTPVISGLNTVCAGAVGVVYTTNNVVGNTYVWNITGGTITAGAGTNSVTVTWNPSGPANLSVAETITATGCSVTTSNYNVTINPNPTPVIGGLATVCSGAAGVAYNTPAVAGDSYFWSISGGVITAGAGTNTVTVTWGAAGTGTLTVAETITATGCVVTTAPFNVLINPNPTPAISGLNTVCASAAGVVYTTNNVVGNTYVWNITGGTITAGAGTNSVTVTWNPSGPANLSVAETITATGCSVTTNNYNVTINPNPTPVIGGLATVCSGAAGVAYNTPAVAGHSYVWTISGGAITAGAGTDAVTVTWGAAGTGTLTVAETITATGCVVTTAPFNVLINPIPTFTITNTTGGGTGQICSGSQTNILLTSPTPGAILTLQNVVYGAVTGGLYAGGGSFPTGGVINESPGGLVNPTNSPIVVTYIFTAATGSCSNLVPQQTSVTINPVPAMSIANTTPAICSGSGVNITLNSVTSGATVTLNSITYGAVTGTITTPVSYTPGSVITESLTNTTSNPVSVTYSFSVSANGCNTAGPFTTVVIVNPLPTSLASPLNTTLCDSQATNIVLSNPNAVAGGVNYNWTVAVISGTVSGQLNGSGTPIVQTLTTNNLGGVVRYTINATSITGSCVGPAVTADVAVNPVPNAAIGAGSTSTLCSGATTNIILQNPNAVAGTTYTWTTSVVSGVVGGHSAGSGATIVQALTTTNAGGVVRYSIRPSASGCLGSIITWDVTVNPTPAAANIVEPVVCSNQAFSYDPQLEITNGVVSTFTWTAAYPAGLTGGAASGSSLVTGTLTNVTGGMLNAVFTITPTAPGPGSCVGIPFTITVPVNPTPVGTTTTLASVCSDVTFSHNPQLEISNGVASNFAWTAVYDAGILGGAPSGSGNIGGTLTNDSGALLNATFTVTPTSVAAPGCSGSSYVLTVPIPTKPKGIAATAATICSKGVVNYNLQTNVNSLGNNVPSNFSWIATSNTNVGGESLTAQSGPIINDILTNISGGNQTVTYTVTPASLGGCFGNPFVITIQVQSEPTGVAFTEAAVCSASPFSYNPQAHITNAMASTFTWTAAYQPGLTGGSGNGTGLLAETLTNLTNGTLNALYTVTPTSGGCVGSSYVITVPVNPQPVGQVQNVTICSNTTTNVTLNTVGTSVAAASYSITGVSFPPTLTAAGTNAPIAAGQLANAIFSDKYTNLTGGALTATYTIAAKSLAGCVGPSFNVVVTVDPEPVGVTQTISTCSDISPNYSLTSNVATAPGNNVGSTFTWIATSNPNVGGESTTLQSGPTITDVLDNVTSIDRTVVYTVTPKSLAGCFGASFQINVVVHPEPVGTTPALHPTICSGNSVSYNLQTSNINGNNSVLSTFTWTGAPNPNISGESSSIHTTTVIDDILTNTDPAFGVQSITYTITPTSSLGCAGNVFTVIVDVNPKAVVSAGPDLAVCATVPIPATPLQGSITYAPNGITWSSSSSGASGFAPATSPTASYTYVPADITTAPTLTITAIDPDGAGPCGPVSDQMVLKVNTPPLVGFTVTGLPGPTFPAPVAQNYAITITANGTQSGGLFTIDFPLTGIGLQPTYIGGDGFDHAVFDPNAAALGVNSIVYSYTDPITGCSNKTALNSHNIIVNPVTLVDFAVDLPGHVNGAGDYEICSDVGLVHIIGLPSPTTGKLPYTRIVFDPIGYTGSTPPVISQDVSGEWFIDTNGLASDTYNIIYYYEQNIPFGAQTQKERALKVYSTPKADMIVPSHCVSSAIAFSDASVNYPIPAGNNAPPPPVPISWTWDFGDGTSTVSGQNPSHLYTNPGIWNVKMTITTAAPQSCSSQVIQPVRVGSSPVVDFIWSSICNGDSTNFIDKTVVQFPSTIQSYAWDFGDLSPVVSGLNGSTIPWVPGSQSSGPYSAPFHKYAGAASYSPQITVTTNDGCSSSLSKNIFTLDSVTVKPAVTAAYFQDFENAVSVGKEWQSQAIVNPADPISWQWTTPNGAVMNSASSGSKAFWTGAHSPSTADSTFYYSDEQTVVNGPCFDLSELSRPMISLDYWVDTQTDFDGAVVQYSINGGNTWANMGVPSEGINWYSPHQIISNPGQQAIGQYGWSGRATGWRNARANLDVIPDSTASNPLPKNPRRQVRIRVAFSSDHTNPPGVLFDGFAFDNVYIGEKRSTVLIEHFTNYIPTVNRNADGYLDILYNTSISTRGTTDFHDVRYHLSNPAGDVFNTDNPVDPAARALFYGVNAPPFTIMDGRLDATFTGYTQGIHMVDIDRRSLMDPKFDLVLTDTVINNKLNFTLDITADTIFNAPLIAQVDLVEKTAVAGGYTLHNILRKQLLGPAGQNLNIPWAGPILPSTPGTSVPIAVSNITIDVPILSPDSLVLIAYVQDKNTKEIYQSTYLPVHNRIVSGPITGLDEPTTEEIQLFPNPANSQFKFGLPDNFPPDYTWSIVDQRGIVVLNGDFTGAVDKQKSVEVRGLADGIYFVIIGKPGHPSIYRKLAVMNLN